MKFFLKLLFSFEGYGQPAATSLYGSNPTANVLNSPFLPVNSVNHPMPTSALYGAQQQQQTATAAAAAQATSPFGSKPASASSSMTSLVPPNKPMSGLPTMNNQNMSSTSSSSFYTPQSNNTISQPPTGFSTFCSLQEEKLKFI